MRRQEDIFRHSIIWRDYHLDLYMGGKCYIHRLYTKHVCITYVSSPHHEKTLANPIKSDGEQKKQWQACGPAAAKEVRKTEFSTEIWMILLLKVQDRHFLSGSSHTTRFHSEYKLRNHNYRHLRDTAGTQTNTTQ